MGWLRDRLNSALPERHLRTRPCSGRPRRHAGEHHGHAVPAAAAVRHAVTAGVGGRNAARPREVARRCPRGTETSEGACCGESATGRDTG